MGEAVKKEVVEWIKVIVIALVLAFAITRFIVPTIV
ncbi:signal peptidase I, partial [Clostridioides difficile]